MDILIKNIEQIDGCYYCPFLTGTTCCACLITGNKVGIDVVRDKYEDERMADCPLVALPEHGDLKDANAILRWLNSKADNRVPVTLGEIIDFIEKQPIVLEAST